VGLIVTALPDIVGGPIASFTPAAQRDRRLLAAGGRVIGQSEAGRDIVGVVVGDGPVKVSLVAGAHSDEPVGAETLLRLVEAVSRGDATPQAAFVIVAHVNPDGEALNRAWMDAWPDPMAYLAHRMREEPGRDVEFAYPDGRVENEQVSSFLSEHGPYDLHMSLHGMAAATGAWHLIERSWVDRTDEIRRGYARAVREAGVALFDWDRGGEKGFHYIGPGFATTPTGVAMREHFDAKGDPDTAAKFQSSSMEYVQSLGGDPLCMVTELPLFLVRGFLDENIPAVPRNYLAFREALEAMDLEGFDIEHVAIDVAARLQLRAIELGIERVNHE